MYIVINIFIIIIVINIIIFIIVNATTVFVFYQFLLTSLLLININFLVFSALPFAPI